MFTNVFTIVFTCVASSRSEAAVYSVCGQMRGDKECPFNGVHSQSWQSLEEGAEK